MQQTIIRNVLIEKQDAHLKFTNPVPVCLDRRSPSRPIHPKPLEAIGTATMERRSDGIYATFVLNVSGNTVKGLYPNIGFVSSQKQPAASDSNVLEGEIKTIVISIFKNTDKSIPKIKTS